jgi:hypothetical protein
MDFAFFSGPNRHGVGTLGVAVPSIRRSSAEQLSEFKTFVLPRRAGMLTRKMPSGIGQSKEDTAFGRQIIRRIMMPTHAIIATIGVETNSTIVP